MTGGIGGHGNERVVTTVGSMEDSHAAGDAFLYTSASGALEDDNRGPGEPSRFHRRTNSLHERPSCPWSIAPPPGWLRPDDIRCIDEKHDSSFTALEP